MPLGISSVSLRFVVPTPAAYMDSPRRAAEEALNSAVVRLDRGLGGVLLAWEGLKSTGSGVAYEEQAETLFSWTCQVLLLKPRRGQVLTGLEVVQVRRDFVTLQYLGVFPCTVTLEDLTSQRLEWTDEIQGFVCGDHMITPGTTQNLEFRDFSATPDGIPEILGVVLVGRRESSSDEEEDDTGDEA